ncbi:MAG TPA: helicase-related protein [Thermomicrobiales bacterium]|nr:helicase-related protein [Thermomicrobiales bacterium]
MAQLEDLKRDVVVKGIVPGQAVAVVDVKWWGGDVIELTYKLDNGNVANQLVYRHQEPDLEIVEQGRPWSFDGDGELFRLVSEAQRIRLAYLFDPLLAVHSSIIDPLPHQITAVYEEMLPRQPLNFLLADDPGAGKTIMAGLLIKELRMRGDLERCLIVCPGSLVEQWQDELHVKFQLPFDIMTRDAIQASRSGNWFTEHPLAICRLDQLARNEDLQRKLQQVDWDLVVVDEAHKMSAAYWGNEFRKTKRYQLGELLREQTRNFLLMTATPHNGREEDFQAFLRLLDEDRFEGRYREGVHSTDADDLMRRLLKEQLVKFDGTPLFPERRAYTVTYELSDAEAALYKAVTEYVREEFNRADALASDGRKGTVGFALTILQRRLASSPEAIYQSLRRRRERLQRRLSEEKLLRRGAEVGLGWARDVPLLSDEDIEDWEDMSEAEATELEEQVVDLASAARTIAELEAEIAILTRLEAQAAEVVALDTDRKWAELSAILQDHARLFDATDSPLKLIIFTEHRDTLNYLTRKIRTLMGRDEAVVEIHGGMHRDARREAQERFVHDPEAQILVATDAAGEGVNLQRAHLMVNYDLPWNPNRLEQRFGRIHRIGQTEVCHLWNLVAAETREGDVFQTLFRKLEQERKSLGGQVFDVLGQVTFDGKPLRELLVEAVRYGNQPEVRERLHRVVETALDHDHLQRLLEQRALATDALNSQMVHRVREEMERAEARRLQPLYIQAFFLKAFERLGGRIREREPRRFEISYVPAIIRQRAAQIGLRDPVLRRYERVTFERELVNVPGKPSASYLAPGHPLLDATVDVLLERHHDVIRRGAVLIDPKDPGQEVRALFYLEHALQDVVQARDGQPRHISRRLQFVELRADGEVSDAGPAPYLDYEPATEEQLAQVEEHLRAGWLSENLPERALGYAISNLVPRHLAEVAERRTAMIDKTLAEVRSRLTREIAYWDHRAEELKLQELAGKQPRMNSGRARQRADELTERLERRIAELEAARQISPLPPVVVGGALIVPAGLLAREAAPDGLPRDPAERRRVELLAMEAVMAAERRLGHEPVDVSSQNLGYDIESREPESGKLRFIEVKGRVAGAESVMVTRNEANTGRNKRDSFILAVVEVNDTAGEPRYFRDIFTKDLDFGVSKLEINLRDIGPLGRPPS